MEKIITIPKNLSRKGDLVIIPKEEYKKLLATQKTTTEDVLRWTREAKTLKQLGKLSRLSF